MGRKILFITTDQQRFDALGCNGGLIARTPNIDALAATGINYNRAHPQNVVCMPSRSTMITGQHVATHGVWMNGVPLPNDAPSVATTLHDAGYKTALIGKAHFEPFLDPFLRFVENQLANSGAHSLIEDGHLHRGFDHMESAGHGGMGSFHYAQWLMKNHPEAVGMYYRVLDMSLQVSAEGGGDTGAPQAHLNNIPREWYHTDWVADRAIAWLDSLDADADWFCWVSFPDPHHPWDPPASETHRVNWRDLDLPAGYPQNRAQREAILDNKPAQWRKWYDGEFVSNYEAPLKWIPNTLTDDQVREVNALTHIENELIDEAVGRMMKRIDERGWGADTDVLFSTDHGEFQGDFGLLFKGPYHVDSLMRIPLIWRPAPSAGINPATVDAPVGHVSLASTFCHIAGLPQPDYAEAPRLPINENEATELGHERVLTEWDSVLFGKIVRLRSICRDGWVATACMPGSLHDGTEGELYNLANDPLQQVNLWSDPSQKSLRDDLLADMWDHLPIPDAVRRECDAPV
ncbi:MAG: sulfatase-like hydrolase/transferase [Ilumatobacteraceae bacterium]|jgi:arylsulfatase A-like enzyme|nr:sulfatase-like hydrolase/transferase [Ilumatobacteraceae bacterium]MDP4977385.1 sulfatase-like hydrolase/transferase [Ilumatobacteraceae bacterium]